MKVNPLVSVILPNYNHAPFLEQRLESIFHQTFQDFEVILLDDDSTDESVEILNRYGHNSKVSHFIVNEDNSGSPFKQWKRGIDLAQGKFIWIAESDDYCDFDFLESLVSLFKEETVLVYSASNMTMESGEVVGLDPWARGNINKRWTRSYFNSGKDEIHKFLRYINTIPNASAVVFKKEAIKDVDIPVKMNFCGDWFIWLELLKKGDIAYLSKPLNFFRTHGNTTRALGNFQREKKRIGEYVYILKDNSSLVERMKNRKSYDWVINQLFENRKRFPNHRISEMNLPLDFQMRYLQKVLRLFYLMIRTKMKRIT